VLTPSAPFYLCNTPHRKDERRDEAKELLHRKIDEYLSRAEKLRSFLNGRNATGSNTPHQRVPDPKISSDQIDELIQANLKGRWFFLFAMYSSKTSYSVLFQPEVIINQSDKGWESLYGLDGAKNALKESILLPVKFPQLFSGKKLSWPGMILHGPPGTGKTCLGESSSL
jgi:vacuolar protein-sorting-associated protein 4